MLFYNYRKDYFCYESLLNWIRYLFLLSKIDFTKSGPLPTSTMEPFVTIIDNWKLLTSVGSSLDPLWLNYDFQRTEEGCLNVNSLVEYADDGRPLFVFIPNPKCNHDSNKTILETLSMSEKALKMLLNIFCNVNAAARFAWGQMQNLTSLVCTSYE